MHDTVAPGRDPTVERFAYLFKPGEVYTRPITVDVARMVERREIHRGNLRRRGQTPWEVDTSNFSLALCERHD